VDVQTAITPMTPTQSLILWTLLGFLLAWMLLFTLLAVRPDTKERIELEDVPVYTTTQPVATPAPKMLQMATAQPGTYLPATANSINNETSVVLEQSQ
jgi:hypothetical protein